jgi:hypothetical protein
MTTEKDRETFYTSGLNPPVASANAGGGINAIHVNTFVTLRIGLIVAYELSVLRDV